MKNVKDINEQLLTRAKEMYPTISGATKEPKNFCKIGELMIPLKNKRDLNKMAGDLFPIKKEGKYTYVICDNLLAEQE